MNLSSKSELPESGSIPHRAMAPTQPKGVTSTTGPNPNYYTITAVIRIVRTLRTTRRIPRIIRKVKIRIAKITIIES